MNIWIMLTISFFVVTTCYFGKREFFDQKDIRLDEEFSDRSIVDDDCRVSGFLECSPSN